MKFAACMLWTAVVTALVPPKRASESPLTVPLRVYTKHKDSNERFLRGELAESSALPEGPLANQQIYYTIDLLLGSNQQSVQLDIDTGSSDLWVVPANVSCNDQNDDCTGGGTYNSSKSTTYKDLGLPFSIIYGDGTTAAGSYVFDTASVPGSRGVGVQFGLAVNDTAGWGLLGVGKVSNEAAAKEYDNFPVALKKQGVIGTAAYSLYLNNPNASTGSLIFGGYDKAKYYGDLVTLPVTTQKDFTVTLTGLTLSNKQEISANIDVLLDSGTTITYLPQNLVDAIARDLDASNSTGGYLFNCDQPTDKLLTYNFNGVSVQIPYYTLLSPTIDQGVSGPSLCVLNVFPAYQAILGDNFLNYAYVVYDLDKNQVQLAQAKFTSDSDVVAF